MPYYIMARSSRTRQFLKVLKLFLIVLIFGLESLEVLVSLVRFGITPTLRLSLSPLFYLVFVNKQVV